MPTVGADVSKSDLPAVHERAGAARPARGAHTAATPLDLRAAFLKTCTSSHIAWTQHVPALPIQTIEAVWCIQAYGPLALPTLRAYVLQGR